MNLIVDVTKDLMQEKVDLAKELTQEIGNVKEKKEQEKVGLTKNLMQELANVKEKKKNRKNQNCQIILQILRMRSNIVLSFSYDHKGCVMLEVL